jgi:bacteriocin-like protein
MTTEILEFENREMSELSDTDLDQVTGGHHGSDVFTWGLIGGVAVVVGTVIVIGLL